MKIGQYKLANEWMREESATPEEALNTWNEMEAEFKANRAMSQEPRTMDQASIADDLEPGALKDELLKDFDPSQETYEEYLQRKRLGERPFNMAEGGQLVKPSVDGSRPGYQGKKKYDFSAPRPERRINPERNLTWQEKKERYEAKHGKIYKTTKVDFTFEGKKISIDAPNMKPKSKNFMKELLKGIEKWKVDPTTENWIKVFKKKKPSRIGPQQYSYGWSTELRKYLQGKETKNPLTKNIFDQLDIKKTLGLSKNEVKMIKSYVDLQSPATATRIASEKLLRKSFENIIEINKHFKTNPNINLDQLTKKIYKSDFTKADDAGKLRMTTSVSDDVAKYLEALKINKKTGKPAREIPKGLKSQWKPPTGKNLDFITDRIFDQTKGFRFQDFTLRKYKYSIRDSMLNLRPGTTFNLERTLNLTKGVLDHTVGLSATFDIAPGYTELYQNLEAAVNTAKGQKIDKPFGEALRAALEKGDFSKIDAYNKIAAAWQKKNPGVDVPFIRKGGDPRELITYFDDMSPEAQENVLKIAKGKKGLAIETKGMPIGKLLDNSWCGTRKAYGGRIGFARGSGCPDSVKRRNFLMLNNDVRTGKITGEAAEQIAKNTAKVVTKAGSKSALASLLGPAGIGLDVIYEVASVGTDIYGGKPWKEAVQDNWIAGAFMPGTSQEEFHKAFFKKHPEAKPYGSGLELEQDYFKTLEKIERLKANTTDRGKADAARQLPELERDLEGIAAQYNALGNATQPGSPEYENYMAAKTEYLDARKATSPATAARLKMELDPIESDRFKSYEKSSPVKIDFSLPGNYTTFEPVVPSSEEVDEVYTKEGYDLSPEDIDYVQKMEKWNQLFNDPENKSMGIRGTQDWRGSEGGRAGYMGGGIASLKK
jgi:hypothetical protein